MELKLNYYCIALDGNMKEKSGFIQFLFLLVFVYGNHLSAAEGKGRRNQ